jgi:hypothetical protein
VRWADNSCRNTITLRTVTQASHFNAVGRRKQWKVGMGFVTRSEKYDSSVEWINLAQDGDSGELL